MIYLNSGIFRPMFILISIITLPIAIACLTLTFINFRVGLLIVTVLMFLSYFAILFAGYKYSKRKEYYLTVQENECIIIEYPHSIGEKYHLQLRPEDIIMIEYYKLCSVKAWCMLYNYVFPQCVYITYVSDGKEICKHIGYPDFIKISKLCAELGINFITK